MIRYVTSIATVVLAVSLRGCPLELPDPLGIPLAGSIDKSLIGSWKWDGQKKKEACELLILPFNDSEYYVEMRESPSSSSDGRSMSVMRFRAFATHIGKKPFLNVKELPVDLAERKWILGTYSFPKPGELDIHFVGEDDVPENIRKSPDAMLGWLPDHLDDPHLYADQSEGVFRRVEVAKEKR